MVEVFKKTRGKGIIVEGFQGVIEVENLSYGIPEGEMVQVVQFVQKS